MPAIGITGGVASGKSTLTGMLAQLLDAPSFNSDACARELLEGDASVAREVRVGFGAGVFSASGAIDRAALRQRVFAQADERRRLEAILHPRVRSSWQNWLQERARTRPGAMWLVEIPLLFETGAAAFFERTIVVGCERETQLRRLTLERRLASDLADRIIASQWDLQQKIGLCDHLLWNDGSLHGLRAQAAVCARFLGHLS